MRLPHGIEDTQRHMGDIGKADSAYHLGRLIPMSQIASAALHSVESPSPNRLRNSMQTLTNESLCTSATACLPLRSYATPPSRPSALQAL
jgi:hypothetical protein